MSQRPMRLYFGRTLVFVILFQALHGELSLLSDEAKRDPRGPGTIGMGKRLQELAARSNPINNIFLNSERVKLIEAEIAKTTDPVLLRALRFSLASELLDAGQNTAALKEFEDVKQDLKNSAPEAFRRNWSKLKHEEALCWIRTGEITNC